MKIKVNTKINLPPLFSDFRFWFSILFKIERKSHSIDREVLAMLKLKPIAFKEEEYDLHFEYEGGKKMQLWNANKYYSWLSSGLITDRLSTTITWNAGTPSRRTTYKVFKLVRSCRKRFKT